MDHAFQPNGIDGDSEGFLPSGSKSLTKMNTIPRGLIALFAVLFLILLSGGAWFHHFQGKRQREDALAAQM